MMLLGALIYYAWARFNPYATAETPYPKSWARYLVADWRAFIWGVMGSIAAYAVWIALHRWGVKITLPTSLPLIGGEVFIFPPVDNIVAFLLGFSGRSFIKMAGPLGRRLWL